ncbi:MAG: lamin tail domain-containing protein [Archangium sp.]
MQTRVAVVIAFLGFAACRVVDPPPPPDAPRITAFTTDKSRIASGESATLTYSTSGASKVVVTDDRGGEVQLSGDASSGTATVAPRNSAFYVLRAVGEGGSDTAFVQIAVNEPLRDVFLLAVPSSIVAGQSAQLLWGAAGASSVTLTPSNGTAQTLTGSTGVVNVTPSRSTEYVLSAQGAPGTPALTALARVAVSPVISAFNFDALNGVKANETINFTWTTAGATRLVLAERTFGTIATITDEASLATGAADFTLPAKLPNGFDISDGLSMHFTLTAYSEAQSVSRTIDTSVGNRPVFDLLTVPEAASVGTQFTIAWRTTNATRVAVLVGGQPLFETLAGDQARVAAGSVKLPAPTAQTDYTIVASNSTGLETRQIRTVRSVNKPTVDTFTITGTVNAGGDNATARWTTTAASRVVLRVEGGGGVYETSSQTTVASGMFVVRPLQTMTFVLEAFNAAGDVDRKTQVVTVSSPAVTISPDPVVRGDQATLTWTLAGLGVTEVVGLASNNIEVVGASSNFIDLSTVAGVQSVVFADGNDGAEKLPPIPGFELHVLNQTRPDLYVSVNGFISYTPPAALNINANMADGGTAPDLIAPFWDDLTLGTDSEVLYAVQSRAGTNEKFLVVQWNKVQLASDPMSELTFQAHLYETGQISFHYKTVNGAANSATTGIKDATRQVRAQYVFDGTPAPVTADLELNFFSAGTADGTQTFTADRAERITFYGRTAQAVLPASALVRAFGSGDVSVNEAMPLPDPSTGASGQWVELRNNAAVTVDLGGLQVSSLGSLDGGFVIPNGTLVDAGAFLVVGQSTDMQDNGGAIVHLIGDDLPLAVPDNVKVSLGVTTIGSLAWSADAGVQNQSIQPVSGLLVATGGQVTCSRAVTYGPNGAFGTPGAANESCAAYTVSSIPGAFVPAPASATLTLSPVGTTFTAIDEGFANVTLPAPFNYFGTPFTSLTAVTNGFLTFGSPITTSAYFSNPTTPSTTAPNGVVAPFWDDLDERAGAKVAAWNATDRFIISWESYQPLSTPGEANVQVHLLNSGVIEFHYGAMTPVTGTDQPRYNGNSATVWLEAPNGSYAIPFSINTASLSPNSGIRFTPK